MTGAPSLVRQYTADAMVELATKTPPGNFLEVGVYKGGTATLLYELTEQQHRKLFLYDTFTGMPYKSAVDEHEIGDLADTSVEEVRQYCPNAVIVPGIFPHSAVDMGPIAFAHIDCDQYQAHVESIEFLLPKMVKGGVIWFDDSTALYGARLAVMSLLGDTVKTYKGKHYVEI